MKNRTYNLLDTFSGAFIRRATTEEAERAKVLALRGRIHTVSFATELGSTVHAAVVPSEEAA